MPASIKDGSSGKPTQNDVAIKCERIKREIIFPHIDKMLDLVNRLNKAKTQEELNAALGDYAKILGGEIADAKGAGK